MIDYSGPIFDEIRELAQMYTDIDPDSDWNDTEWYAFAREHASENLLKYMEENGEYWFYRKPNENEDIM